MFVPLSIFMIILLKGTFEEDSEVYIVMDLCERNLVSYLSDYGPLEWKETDSVCGELMLCLRHLHDMLDIAHKNLKVMSLWSTIIFSNVV